MQYASMQTLFDSLCQCLGSSPTLPQDGSDPPIVMSGPGGGGYGGGGNSITGSPPHNSGNNNGGSPASRRTNRLELKDKQWDALFDAVTPNINSNKLMQQTQTDQGMTTHRHGGSPSSSPDSSPNNRGRNIAEHGDGTSPLVETAHVLAKAKQAANPSRYQISSQRDAPPSSSSSHPTTSASGTTNSHHNTATSGGAKSHKRKRPTSSRDDIFRSRKAGSTTTKGRTACEAADGSCMNPISKFLSNHQGFASALCFATPVRDEDEPEDDYKDDQHHPNGGANNNDNNSLASDANTLNTCEDSMLLLDHKLAAMSKNQPPMPLFHDFKVNQNEPEGLRRIVDAETHSSSSNLMRAWRTSQEDVLNGSNIIVPSSSSSSSSSGGRRGRARVRYPPAPPAIPEDEGPPPMKSSSTNSSSESERQIGEI